MSNFRFKNLKKKNYFEGWYTRVIDDQNEINLAIIFGLTKYTKDPHAFIQVFDGLKHTNKYYRFDSTLFIDNGSYVQIQENKLSDHDVSIHLDDYDIEIQMSNQKRLGEGVFKKSAMSYLSYAPLECFQEVVYMDASYDGSIRLNGKKIQSTGTSYMEKTFGHKFPNKWIWIQSNHFKKDSSISLAIASVPFLIFRKIGFFVILEYQGKQIRFATYHFDSYRINELTQNSCQLEFKRGKYKLLIDHAQSKTTSLVGPRKNANMIGEVFEALDGRLSYRLYFKNSLIFEDEAINVGSEIMTKKGDL